jgi:hypothetical protein
MTFMSEDIILIMYSLRFILLAIDMDVSRTKIYLCTYILESTNMDQREYPKEQSGAVQQ